MDTSNTQHSTIENMVNLVRLLAESLVDEPGGVVVEAMTRNGETMLRLRVAADDIGKIIGKQGRTARSLRSILSAASMKHKQRFSLDIVEAAPEDEVKVFADEIDNGQVWARSRSGNEE